jgi:hypothetical protein
MDLRVLGEVDSRDSASYSIDGAGGGVDGNRQIEDGLWARVRRTGRCRTRADETGAEIILSAVDSGFSPVGGILLIALVRTAVGADDAITWPV